MTIRSLGGVVALSLMAALVAPASALASHRHSRSCGHRSYGYSSYYNSRPSYGYSGNYGGGYYQQPYSYGYDSDPYAYGYGSYYSRPYYRPRPSVRFHYHHGARCYRNHGSVFFGW